MKLFLVTLLNLMTADTAAAQGEASLAQRIGTALDALQAKSSLYRKHLPTGRKVAVRAGAAGKLDLDERYTVRPEDRRRESGPLQTFASGISSSPSSSSIP